jgi:hypothetical protein
VFFPESAYGPTIDCIGIGEVLLLGDEAVRERCAAVSRRLQAAPGTEREQAARLIEELVRAEATPAI